MAIIASALLSAFAFTAGSAIYDQFRNSDAERHNKALERLNEETVKYNKEKQMALEYANYQLKLQQDAVADFNDIDAALIRYNEVFPDKKIELREPPKLTDYYVPSNEEYLIMIFSGLLAGYIVYNYI